MRRNEMALAWFAALIFVTSAIILAGLAIAPAFGQAQSSSGGGGAPGEINVESYGAYGDGTIWTTNDTPAIQAAIDAAEAAGSKRVKLGVGTYYLQTTLDIAVDGLILEGSGRSDPGGDWSGGTILYTLTLPINAGQTGIRVGHKADSTVTWGVEIRDLTIRSDVTGRIGHTIWAQNVQDFHLNNIGIRASSQALPDSTYAAVYIQAANRYALRTGNWNLQTTNNRITDCTIWGPQGNGSSGRGYGILVACTTDSSSNTGLMISNTFIADCKSPGRSALFTGNDPGGSELLDAVCNGHRIVNSHLGGHSGIEFCNSDWNMVVGSLIDMSPADGDTAVLNRCDSRRNFIIGRCDGYIFDEQEDPFLKLQVYDPAYQHGPHLAAVGFEAVGTNKPGLGGGETEPTGTTLIYDETIERFLFWNDTAAKWDTLAARGD